MEEKEILRLLNNLLEINEMQQIKKEISELIVKLPNSYYKHFREVLLKSIASKSLDRTKYYIRSAIKCLCDIKTNGINDINLNRWRDYDHIITDSLWIFECRDRGNGHSAWYWGNFIPQIPRQLMLRYTKKYEWILDPFCGSGTTIIEAIRLGRNAVGIELSRETVEKSLEIIKEVENEYRVVSEIFAGDSVEFDFRKLLEIYNIRGFKLVILHPPYHNIITFTNDPRDLSNAPTLEDFLFKLEIVIRKSADVLLSPGYLAIVIGDKYSKGKWIPLGFYCMERAMKCGLNLKSIVVKNFEIGRTRGKRFNKELWRYRALVGGYYIFSHEYIFIFEK